MSGPLDERRLVRPVETVLPGPPQGLAEHLITEALGVWTRRKLSRSRVRTTNPRPTP